VDPDLLIPSGVGTLYLLQFLSFRRFQHLTPVILPM
jgi:hypothetical protein